MFTPMQANPASSIADEIRERFRKVAHGPRGHFSYPTGRDGLVRLNYAADAIDSLPTTVQDYYCGVGNPFAAGIPRAGVRVLDVGCGAGVDALIAAYHVGPSGHVEGLEFSPAMLARAKTNAAEAGCSTVVFMEGSAEKLPYGDGTFDLLISNGVFNLVLRKRQALEEAYRTLRPGGVLQIADQILEADEPPQMAQVSPGAWAT